MSTEQIQQIEQQIGELTVQLSELRKASPAIAVPNYTFETNAGETTLLDLFGPQDKLCLRRCVKLSRSCHLREKR